MIDIKTEYPNLQHIEFDTETIDWGNPEINRECLLIAFDLETNACLYPASHQSIQKFNFKIAQENSKLKLQFTNINNHDDILYFIISYSPYVNLIREYKYICNSYKNAILHDTITNIETIDMARRGLHNQAADLIQNRMLDKIKGNHAAFRHLFTLMTLLVHTK